jgi:hypothetical protein
MNAFGRTDVFVINGLTVPKQIILLIFSLTTGMGYNLSVLWRKFSLQVSENYANIRSLFIILCIGGDSH